jgi:hypothetical protein
MFSLEVRAWFGKEKSMPSIRLTRASQGFFHGMWLWEVTHIHLARSYPYGGYSRWAAIVYRLAFVLGPSRVMLREVSAFFCVFNHGHATHRRFLARF